MKRIVWATVAAMTVAMTACTGSGASEGDTLNPGPSPSASPTPAPSPSPSPSPSPTPQNTAPEITSSADLSVVEKTAAAFHTVTASDAEGDALGFSLSGVDADFFSINAANGALRLLETADFDRPADADGDNIYLVDVTVDDGTDETTQSLSITLQNLSVSPEAVLISDTLAQPLFVTGLPGGQAAGLGDAIAVVERTGTIRIVTGDGDVLDTPLLDISNSISTAGELGLLGLAFSPEFATDRAFYVYTSNTDNNTEIRKFTMVLGSNTEADLASEDVILRITQPFTNHNAGWIGFGPDGMLYAPLGDGGSSNDPNNNGQDPTTLLGSVLRIDVSRDDFPTDDLRDYAIPADNPFVSGSGERPEVFAFGLRNPYRAAFDPVTGDLLIGDVGQNQREEVNRLSLNEPGANFGWRIMEGTLEYRGDRQPEFIDPVVEYSHGTGPTEGSSITGGVVVRDNNDFEWFENHYLFGDFITGNLWIAPIDALESGQTLNGDDLTRVNDLLGAAFGGATPSVTGFGVSLGNVYYFTAISGELWKLQTPDQ